MKLIKTRIRRRQAFMLIDCMVYSVVLLALLGVAYITLHRSTESSMILRRNTEDVARALQAGERWRADVRAANQPIRFEMNDDGQVIVMPTARGDVAYQFTTNGVFRRVGENGWACLLPSVNASTMQSEDRAGVTIWRWELEMKPRSKRPVRVRPLFTFLAAPQTGRAK